MLSTSSGANVPRWFAGIAFALLALLLTHTVTHADEPKIEATGTLKDTGIRHVNAAQASSLIEAHPEIVVLDVRTKREFDGGHLDGAVNLDFFSPEFKQRVEQLDTEKTYVLHCRSGNRSSKAARLLKDAGIESVVHMDGGVKAWRKADLPLVTEEN